MNYKVIDKESYYRKGVFRHFSEDCKCSCSITARLDVTELVRYSEASGTKFYLNFLYLLSKVLNSRDDYRMAWLWQTGELICYDTIHPTQYVFHEDTETCSPVYSTYCEDYESFYAGALADLERAKGTRDYALDAEKHPNRHPDSMDMSLSKLWEIVRKAKPGMLQSMGSQRVGHDLVIEQQQCLIW